jgi:hypothetical protein
MQMHAQTGFDDALSGTTSISVLVRDRTLFVSNVGDSRAIIISTAADGRLLARPLSNDQTPYREDERARCKKTGARVLSYDQIEGLEPMHEVRPTHIRLYFYTSIVHTNPPQPTAHRNTAHLYTYTPIPLFLYLFPLVCIHIYT